MNFKGQTVKIIKCYYRTTRISGRDKNGGNTLSGARLKQLQQ